MIDHLDIIRSIKKPELGWSLLRRWRRWFYDQKN